MSMTSTTANVDGMHGEQVDNRSASDDATFDEFDEQSANSEDHRFSKDEEFAVAPASDDEQSDSDNESFSMLTSSNPSTFLLWSKDADKG